MSLARRIAERLRNEPRPCRFGQRSPCAECPWRADLPPDGPHMAAASMETMARTVDVTGPLLACHMDARAKPQACVGHLMVVGPRHFAANLAQSMGKVNLAALRSDAPLYESFEALRAAVEAKNDAR